MYFYQIFLLLLSGWKSHIIEFISTEFVFNFCQPLGLNSPCLPHFIKGVRRETEISGLIFASGETHGYFHGAVTGLLTNGASQNS